MKTIKISHEEISNYRNLFKSHKSIHLFVTLRPLTSYFDDEDDSFHEQWVDDSELVASFSNPFSAFDYLESNHDIIVSKIKIKFSHFIILDTYNQILYTDY